MTEADSTPLSTDAADVQPETSASSSPVKKSRFSPAVKGALAGAAAGSILPVFGTVSGALIGAIAGKIYEKKCLKNH